MRDWARRHRAAAIATALAAAATLPATVGDPFANDVPLLWIGHSRGGQIERFAPNVGRIVGLVTVAAGSASSAPSRAA